MDCRNLNSFPAENLVRLRCGPFFFLRKRKDKWKLLYVSTIASNKIYVLYKVWLENVLELHLWEKCSPKINTYIGSWYQGTRNRNVTEMLYLLRKPLSPTSVVLTDRKRTVHFWAVLHSYSIANCVTANFVASWLKWLQMI